MAFLNKAISLGGARKFASRHSEQVNGGIDKVVHLVKGRAPKQHAGKVDTAGSYLKRVATGSATDAPRTDERDKKK